MNAKVFEHKSRHSLIFRVIFRHSIVSEHGRLACYDRRQRVFRGLVLRGGAGPKGESDGERGIDDVFQAACEQLLRAEGSGASKGGGSTRGADDGTRARRSGGEDLDMADAAVVISAASSGIVSGAEPVVHATHHGAGRGCYAHDDVSPLLLCA